MFFRFWLFVVWVVRLYSVLQLFYTKLLHITQTIYGKEIYDFFLVFHSFLTDVWTKLIAHYFQTNFIYDCILQILTTQTPYIAFPPSCMFREAQRHVDVLAYDKLLLHVLDLFRLNKIKWKANWKVMNHFNKHKHTCYWRKTIDIHFIILNVLFCVSNCQVLP